MYILDYIIVGLIMLYGTRLTFKEYGHVVGYLAAVASVYFGTVTKEMIVLVMVR